jgi:predicted transcriptional regulator YdeE
VIGLQIGGTDAPDVSYGVMDHPDGSLASLLYTAAVSVRAPSQIPQGMVSLEIPAGSYARFRFPLSGLGKGFGEIFNRLLPSSYFTRITGRTLKGMTNSSIPTTPMRASRSTFPSVGERRHE